MYQELVLIQQTFQSIQQIGIILNKLLQVNIYIIHQAHIVQLHYHYLHKH